MKYVIAVVLLASTLSCKTEKKSKEIEVELAEPNTETRVDLERYPEPLLKVFEAHGGWKNGKIRGLWSSN